MLNGNNQSNKNEQRSFLLLVLIGLSLLVGAGCLALGISTFFSSNSDSPNAENQTPVSEPIEQDSSDNEIQGSNVENTSKTNSTTNSETTWLNTDILSVLDETLREKFYRQVDDELFKLAISTKDRVVDIKSCEQVTTTTTFWSVVIECNNRQFNCTYTDATWHAGEIKDDPDSIPNTSQDEAMLVPIDDSMFQNILGECSGTYLDEWASFYSEQDETGDAMTSQVYTATMHGDSSGIVFFEILVPSSGNTYWAWINVPERIVSYSSELPN